MAPTAHAPRTRGGQEPAGLGSGAVRLSASPPALWLDRAVALVYAQGMGADETFGATYRVDALRDHDSGIVRGSVHRAPLVAGAPRLIPSVAMSGGIGHASDGLIVHPPVPLSKRLTRGLLVFLKGKTRLLPVRKLHVHRRDTGESKILERLGGQGAAPAAPAVQRHFCV